MIDANGREWRIATAQFDCGRYWGVAIASPEPIGLKRRRFAVAVEPELSEQDAVAKAMPRLLEWANSEAWDTRKA